ncbi:MAG TPA: HesA/MoeB/ThiF family protein, partial [Ohtaekwangia sp.]|nr:HesA/MoeB/ThiF family protein [Ohtaekwangia sp.]
MDLSQEELKRYNRHLILKEFGLKNQIKLKNSKVLVVGAGGLGSPGLFYLAAAGVGTLGIADFDKVDISNLQRQVLFTEQDLGKNKAKCAAQRLKERNAHLRYIVFEEKIATANVMHILRDYDVILDGTDNFSTRYLLNDACVLLNKPLVYGSILRFEGQVAVFNENKG